MKNSRIWLAKVLGAAALFAVAAAPALASTDDGAQLETQRAQLDAAAHGQGAQQVNSQIVSAFSGLAGSNENAQALASGLRTGEPIVLNGTDADGNPTTTTITPSTSTMGWGNVYTALALTQASLSQQGITDPSSAQLSDALTSILNQRADGTGWGVIAQNLGVKLGPVISDLRSANGQLHAEQGGASNNGHATTAHAQPSSHPGQTAMGNHMDRPDRPARPARPDRPQRPSLPDRPPRPAHPGR